MHGLVGPRAVLQAKSIEWWTPPSFIELARKTMGRIDLDPASCSAANKNVRARKFFDRKINGLAKRWQGTVWLNPPYGNQAKLFICKLLAEWNAGHVEQAVVLLNCNSIETHWFTPLRKFPLCFTRGRIHFISPDCKITSATHGSVFVYFGDRRLAFIKHFGAVGDVFEVVEPKAVEMWSKPFDYPERL